VRPGHQSVIDAVVSKQHTLGQPFRTEGIPVLPYHGNSERTTV